MKPIFPIKITSLNNTSSDVNAVFDSGSFYTIIRNDKLPLNTVILPQITTFRTANKNGGLRVIGQTILIFSIGEKMIQGEVLVSPDLGSEILIGAGLMQTWDISIINKKGKTKIKIEHDMRDPEINEVV